MFAPGQNQLLANLSLLLFFKDLSIVRFYDFKKNFRGMCFTVQLSKIGFYIAVCLKQLCYYIMSFPACQELFSTFWSRFCFSLAATLISYHIQPAVVKNFFHFFLTALWSLWDLSDATLIGYHRCLDLSISFYYFSCNLFIRVNHYISDSFLMFIKR